MTHRVRAEWVDEPRYLPGAVDEAPVTMSNFAYEATGAVLAVEPRLAGLALLVERCATGAGMDEAAWRTVDAFASMLLGPSRSATQTTAVNAASRAVSSDLHGEVIRQRFCTALRRAADRGRAA